MQDLNTIAKVNAKAEEEFAEKLAKEGRFVVAKYSGLQYVGYGDYATEADRNQAAIEWGNAGPSNRTRLLNPAI